MKALLEEIGLTIPRTHILTDLLGLLHPHHSSLIRLRRGLVMLTRFAVGTRYPGATASKREAEAALRWANKVRIQVRGVLGLSLPPRRRRR